jgi:peptide/nickel transport system permease protein
VLSIVVGLALGVPGGLLAASRPGAARDHATSVLSLLSLSLPTFLVATALSSWLANSLGYNPNGEEFATLVSDPGLNLQQMVLPALVLGVSIAAPVFQTTRASVLSIREEDYIRTARAKGVPPRRLQWRHVLRNALIPVLTMGGLQFGFLLGGALVAEQVFSIPGLGRQVLLGMTQKEYAVVQSTVLVIAVMFVLVNLLTDLLYRVVDPQARAR